MQYWHRSWLRLLPLLAVVGLLVIGQTRLATATSHYVLTVPTANSLWLAGTTMTIQWTGGPPATAVKLVLGDVPSWTTAATIGVNLPNTGSYTWTIPANLPTSTYLVYIEAMDQSTWAYGPHITIQAVDTRPDLTITKKSVDPLLAGQNATYQVMVTNVGTGPAAGPITVTDTLGAGLSFVSATGSGWTCTGVGQTVTCTQPGPLAAGQSLPLLTMTVAIARDVTVAENCASVATGQNAGTPGDGNPENDRTCVKEEVTLPPVGDPCGVKFNDLNGNGIQDPGDPGLPGWTIEIKDAQGNLVTTIVTGRGGRFCFKELKAGTYTVSEVQQAGWSQTFPAAPGNHTVTVGSALGTAPLIMFGNQQNPPMGGVCGVKFNDLNGNGIQDSGEPGLPGWTIEIKDAQGNLIAQVVTDDRGQFCLKGVPFGTYTISEVNQAGWTQTYPASGFYTATLDAVHPTWESLLFGNRKTAITGSVCGDKFNDLNGNGSQDPGEPGLPGWTIEARDAQGNLIAQVVTDRNGRFCFGDLRSGTYTFTEVLQTGWTQTYPTTPGTHTVNITGGQHASAIDFGNQRQTKPLSPDLTITKKPVDPLLTGQNATYHVVVTNVGSGPAAGPITVTDTLGAGLSFVTATGSGWSCTAVGQTVTCTQPGPLAAGQSLPLLTLTVAIAPDVTVAENCAAVATGQNASNPGDSNPENDRTCVKEEVTPPPVGDQCGVKFNDLNGNGTQDPAEPGLPGWTIQIKDAMGNVVATTVTEPGGRFCFKGLKAGAYTVSEVQQSGWSQTFPSAPGTYTVNVVGGHIAPTIAFGNQQKAEPCCLTFRLPAGRADNFSTSGATEGTYPSLALLQAFGLSTHAGFDESQMDRFFVHTFWLPAGNCLKSARLEIKAKPLGSNSLVANDTIGLRFSGVPGSPMWSSYFGSGQSSTGLLSSPWFLTNYSGGHVFTLDLGSLPGGTNLLPWLQSQRFLDVAVQDDTTVDYMALNLEFCECAGVAEPVLDTISVVAKTVVRLGLDSVDATVNGEPRRMAAATVVQDGSTLVPLRWIGEALGAEIQWDGNERRVTFLLGGRTVEIWIDQTRARLNGAETSLPVAPTLIGGSTFVPVRFVSEALGAGVIFDPNDRSITIAYPR